MVIGTVEQTEKQPMNEKDGHVDAIDWDEQVGNDHLHRWILAVEQCFDGTTSGKFSTKRSWSG